jgi:hypothetical protein
MYPELGTLDFAKLQTLVETKEYDFQSYLCGLEGQKHLT